MNGKKETIPTDVQAPGEGEAEERGGLEKGYGGQEGMISFYIFLIAGCALLGVHERGKVYDRVLLRVERRLVVGMK